MTEEYRRGHAAGYASGIRDTQPNWIKAEERNPDSAGFYWVIGEFLEDRHGWKKGDCRIETEAPWSGEEWLGNGKAWRILYWAEQPIITPPRELMGRDFNKARYQYKDHTFTEYPEAG